MLLAKLDMRCKNDKFKRNIVEFQSFFQNSLRLECSAVQLSSFNKFFQR